MKNEHPESHAGLWALLFAVVAVGLALFLGRGCRPAPALLPMPRRFVDMDALLPLHPAWAQVTGLDQRLAVLATPQSYGPPTGGRVAQALPKPFLPPPVQTASLAAERQRVVSEDAQHYLQRLTEALQRRKQEQIQALGALEGRRTVAEIARQQAALKQEAQDSNALLERPYDRKITRLQYQQFAFKNQSDTYSGQAHLDALAQMRQVDAQIDALARERDDMLEKSARLLAEKIAGVETRITQESARKIQNLRETLERNDTEQIAREREQLALQKEPLMPLAAAPLPAMTPFATHYTLAFASLPPVPSGPTQTGGATAAQQANWARRRAALIDLIRRDTRQAVDRIAHKEGWRSITQGRPFRPDATGAVRQALIRQWRLLP